MKTLSLISSLIMISACASLGTRPTESDKARFADSTNFNSEKGVFENRRPKYMAEMRANMKFWPMLKDWLRGGIDRVPKEPLPDQIPNMTEFMKPSDDIKVVWFGHSSFLLNLSGKIILVDPVFSNSASPVSFLVKRFQKPVLKLEDLPKVDYILISHDHYDHLDMDSIKYFKEKDVTFITPLGVGGHMRGWGIAEHKIIERDWWESFSQDGVTMTATPAQHFSGRSGFDNNSTLWASWVIKTKDHSVYFSGDTGYDVHFKEIGEKLGPFDVAFLESGQYNERWAQVHMLPEQAVQAFKDLNAKKYFPVHWGMFELAFHTWFEPIEKLFQFSKTEDFDLLAPKIGQIVSVKETSTIDPWWEAVERESQASREESVTTRWADHQPLPQPE